jgi:ribonuclease-3
MNNEELQAVQERIDYWFENPDLLQQAFIRRSYSQEYGGGDNEVLEFIGDKALDFIIVKLLSEEYGDYAENYDDYDPNEDCNEYISDCRENKLSEMKRVLVEGKTLAKRIDILDLSGYLILGKGDQKNKVYNNASVKEDLFEAIIGAVALDSDWDIETLEEVIDRMLDPYSYISDDIEDQYISIVQNWSIKNCGRYPDFICDKNKNFNPYVSSFTVNTDDRFQCKLILGDEEFIGYGDTSSEARRNSAEQAYNYLEENELLSTIQDEIEEPSKSMAINQLETLSRRGYFDLPKYKYTETHDKNGNPVWQVTCMVNDFDKVFNATDSSKKKAKKKAAFKMLIYILENYDEED